MRGPKIDYWMQFLSGITLFSILFSPDINISDSLPAIQALDILLPVLLLFIFLKRKSLSWQHYYTFLLVTGIYILITMGINGRFGVIRDYFEIYKIYKFLAVILFYTLIDVQLFLKTWLKPLFAGLVLVNLIHFFNLFNINIIIQDVYDGGMNIVYFGKNSLGMPAGKRMIGLMINPNNNAILFSFFVVYFFPFKFSKEKVMLFSLALFMTFLCQSRTSMVAIVCMVGFLFLFKLVKWNFKEWGSFLGVVVGCYLVAWMFSSHFFQYPVYGNSMFNGVAIESQSAMGRLEVWRYLWEMIIQKPFFGFGPNKDFFYDNCLYSENEYILFAWRYGFLGVFMYLLFYLIPLRTIVFKHKSPYSNYLILILILLLVTALTNNPLSERNILILFAISLGMIYNLTFRHKKQIQTDGREKNV